MIQLKSKNNRFLVLSAGIVCLLIALLATGSACNKKVSSYNPDFVGVWRTAIINDTVINQVVRSEIVIEKRDGLFNNTCKDSCGERLCDCVSQLSGRAVVNFDKTRLRIGSSTSYSLAIDKEPYQDASGQWIMILEGLTYYKQP